MEEHLCPYILECPIAIPTWDVDKDYVDWFMQILHLYVNPVGQLQPPIELCPPLVDVYMTTEPLPRASQRPVDRPKSSAAAERRAHVPSIWSEASRLGWPRLGQGRRSGKLEDRWPRKERHNRQRLHICLHVHQFRPT
ncbi:hypothetical protein V2J09_000608 [Rumex salicifolius]